MLKNARELKGSKFNNVFISRDYTLKERADRKKLEAELKERREEGEEDIVIRAGRITRKHKVVQDETKNEHEEASRLRVFRD